VLFLPREVEESPAAKAVVDRLLGEGLRAVRYLDVRQSMSNGGGPACLRLRVTLTDDESADVLPGVRFTDALRTSLEAWADTRYREELRPADLADPKLAIETREALDELTQILGLGDDFYAFQRA